MVNKNLKNLISVSYIMYLQSVHVSSIGDKFCEVQCGYFCVSGVFLSLVGADGEETLEGPIEEVARLEAQEAEDLLSDLGIPVSGEAT